MTTATIALTELAESRAVSSRSTPPSSERPKPATLADWSVRRSLN